LYVKVNADGYGAMMEFPANRPKVNKPLEQQTMSVQGTSAAGQNLKRSISAGSRLMSMRRPRRHEADSL
jgi:glutamate dehydrogenase/leucine dehydrogenase